MFVNTVWSLTRNEPPVEEGVRSVFVFESVAEWEALGHTTPQPTSPVKKIAEE